MSIPAVWSQFELEIVATPRLPILPTEIWSTALVSGRLIEPIAFSWRDRQSYVSPAEIVYVVIRVEHV